MDRIVQDHEKRIIALEEFQIQTNKNIEELKQSQMQTQNSVVKMENTVIKSANDTREILQPFAEHVINQAKFNAQTENDFKVKKLETRQRIIIGVFGGGGLAGVVAALVALFTQ